MAKKIQNTGIGAPVPRVEDERLLRGLGRFSDDRTSENCLALAVLRSPHAHAEIISVDLSDARAMPGVVAVLCGSDWMDEGRKPMPAWGNPKDVELKNRDGSAIFYTPLYPVAVGRVRRVGEPVAIVVAENLFIAMQAMDAIAVEYKPLPAVTAMEDDSAAVLWQDVTNNVSVDDVKGDPTASDAVFDTAPHVIKLRTWNNRVTGVPMEPRAALAQIDSASGHITLYTGGQGVNRFQNELIATFGLEKSALRVVSEDVGGGYGTRNHTYPEFALTIWAAMKTGRDVKWRATRSECFLSDYAGRDLLTEAELALDKDGKVLAMRSWNTGNLGTHTISFVPFARGPSVYNGVYHMPIADVTTKLVFTNQTPTASYRGAGRPESMFVIERLMDMAARQLDIDRVDIRRRNMIGIGAIPYTNAVGTTYDSGEFEKSMDMALQLVDWSGFAYRRKQARAQGRFIGIGLANYIETATGYPQERCEMEITPEGIVDLIMGTQSSGQGHETSYAQVVSEWLCVPFETVKLRTGDTDFVSMGSGSHSSRSMRLAGHLYRQTADIIIERGKAIAAHYLEAAIADIVFDDGAFVIAGSDRALSLFDVACHAVSEETPVDLRGPLRAVADITSHLPAFPNGCHACEVEVDIETGEVEILRYVAVDDVGKVINPMIVDGQSHGGIAQGFGQALMEECTYDPDTGQLLAGSFMDYAMPRAGQLPYFQTAFNEVIADSTELGVKGGGEGGTTAAPPAIINAIVDALSEFGVEHLEMPATPERVWRAIRQARG